MTDQTLAQLIVAAVAEAQRRVLAELAELREELARVQGEPRTPSNPPNANANPARPVHGDEVGAQSSQRGRLLRAEDVGMTEREWRGAIHRGELRAAKIGRGYAATQADFDAFLAARLVCPRPRRARKRSLDPATATVERALAAGHLRTTTPRGKR